MGVIHPVESYWLHWGPKEQTQLIRDELENNFKNIVGWLLANFIDFDFICESLLPSQAPEQQGDVFRVGEMNYAAVIVPGCETLRSSTLKRLKNFRQAGGNIVFAGPPAIYVDAKPSDAVKSLARECD